MAEELSIEEAFGLAPNNVPAAKEKEFSIEEAFGAAPVVSNEPTAEELETASKPFIGYRPNVSAPKTRQKQESVLQGVNMGVPDFGSYLKNQKAVDEIIKAGQAEQNEKQNILNKKAAYDREQLKKQADKEQYGATDLAKDIGLGVSKGVVDLGQMGVGLANIATGWYPDNELGIGQWGKMLDKLNYDPQKTNEFLSSFQSASLRNQAQNVQETSGFFNTMKALGANPLAIVDSISESIPGTVLAGGVGGQFTKMLMGKAAEEAASLGLVGTKADEFIANKIKEQTYKIAAASSSAEGAQSSGQIAEQARENGADWNIYVAPALAAGFGTAAIGMISGKAAQKFGIGDVQTQIAARTAGIKGVGEGEGAFLNRLLKEGVKEGVFEEMPQSYQEQIFTNLATGKPWDEGIDAAAAQGLIQGLVMAGGHTSTVEALQKTSSTLKNIGAPREGAYQQDTSYEGLSDLIARSKGFLTPAQQEQQQQEQTTDTNLGTVNNEVPGTQTTETTVPAQTAETTVPAQTTPPLTKEQRIQNEVERLQTRSIPADAALQIATERVNRQEQAIATQPVTGRIEQRTQELIASGVLPTQALAQATKQIEAEDLADQEAQGEINAARPNAQPPGTSVQTSEQPTAVQGTTTGTQGTQRNGVVFNQQNAPSGTAGKGQQPTAVKETSFVPVGFTYRVLESPAYEGQKPLSLEDADFELEALQLSAEKGRMSPQRFAESEIGKRLDTTQVMKVNEGLRTDPVKTIQDLRNSIQQKSAVETTPTVLHAPKNIRPLRVSMAPTGGYFIEWANGTPASDAKYDTAQEAKAAATQQFPTYKVAADVYSPEQKAFITEPIKKEEQPATSDIRTEVQALTTPAKRGRKATPEKTAANKAKRNEITKQNNKVDRTELPKIINDLKEATAPINEDLTLEEAKQAEIDRGQKKRSAIRKLIELSEHPLNEKNSATDKRISAVLNNRNIISQQEIDNVRRGMKVSGQALANKNNVIGPVQSKFLMKTTGRPNNAFKKAKTGQEALDIVKKTGTKFEKFLATRLKPFLKNVEFVVLEDGEPLPDELNGTRNGKFWTKSAQGLYVEDAMRKKKIIYVRGASGGNFQGINNTTVLHEAWHAATNLKILMAQESIDNNVQLNSPLVKAYQDLEQVIENAVEEFKRQAFEALDNPENKGELPYRLQAIYDLIKNGPIFEDAREFVSYALTDEDLQDFLMDVKGFKTNQSLWSKFVDVGRRLLGIPPGDNNALSDMLVVSNSFLSARATSLQKDMGLSLYAEPSRQTGPDNDLTDEEEKALKDPILEGIQALDAEFKKAMDTFQKSEDGAEAAKNASLLQALRDPKRILPALNYAVKGMSSRTLKRYVRIPPVSVLASNTATAVPRITEMYKNVQNMKGMTHSLLESGAKVVTLIHKTQIAQPGLKDKLNRVAFMSTLMKYDPSNPNNKIRNVEMDNMYKALGAEGQFVYKHVKEYFEDLSDYFSNILDEQIKNSGLPAEEQEKLMAKIRQMYEASKKIDPYFPLVRFGSYWLRIGEGDQKQFFMFESSEERDAARDELAPKYKGQKIVVGDSLKGLREDNFRSSEMLKEIFGLIDRTSSLAEAEDKEAVKDAVYQIFLTTMPEQSFRNQFISRKGLAGFSPDFQRSVAQAVTNMGTQLPRLKYAPILRNQIAAARQAISERHRYAPFVDEMERRIRLELSPPQKGLSDKFANGLNTATYIYYLSAAKSAIIQPTSVFQLGFAQLSKKHGYVAAAKELTSFLWVFDKFGVTTTNLDGSKSFVFPSITESNKLTPKEKEAVRLMVSRNVTQSTYANAIFNFRTTPTDKLDGPAMERLKGTVNMFVLGGLMGSAERLSREIVYLASYRLNIKAKLSHEAAIDMAVEDVNESLGDYDSFNRAPWMKSAAGKIFTPFDMYPITVTVYLIKNFTRMLPLLNKEGKVEALRAFFGALGTTWIWAGVVGLPSYSIYMGLLGLFWKKHEKDKPNDMRGIDYRSWFESKEMPRVLGELSIAGIKLSDYVKDPAALALRGPANYMTGLDFSSSTSLNDLWFRQTKETKNMHDEAMALALEKAGASVNMLVAEAEGISELMDGNYQKAAEKMLPASLRGPVVAAKWVREGVKDNKGDVIIKKGAITPTELIGKVINFNPDILSNAQEMTFRFYAIEQRVQNERQKILDQLDAAYRNNDSKTYAERYKEMEKFNIKYSLVFPEYEITQDNIVEAFDTRAQQRAQSWNGVTLSEKNAVAANEILKPSRKAIVERVKKTQGQ